MRTNILGRVRRSMMLFQPRSIEGVAALYLARLYDDARHVREYAGAVDHVGIRAAAELYRTSVELFPDIEGRRKWFRDAVGSSIRPRGFPLPQEPIISLRIERRAICLAVFLGTELHYTQVRELPGVGDNARASAAGFVRWCLAHFRNGIVTLDRGSAGESTRCRVLSDAVVAVTRESNAPIWEITSSELYVAFREPASQSRAKFRDSVREIWPALSPEAPRRALLDAVGLGLLVSIKRTFGDTEPVAVAT